MPQPQARVAVFGLGHVGLPLAIALTDAGFQVAGIDLDVVRVNVLAQCRSPLSSVSASDVARARARGLTVSNRPAQADEWDVAIVAVPTPLYEGNPDLTQLSDVCTTLASQLKADDLIVIESTVAPGTTRGLVRHILESGSGLTTENDFFLSYSPERIDPGNDLWRLKNTPKIVSAIGPKSQTVAVSFYRSFVDEVIAVDRLEEAELAKLVENTYRLINIAFVNELSRACGELGIDVWATLKAASSKPFGYQSFLPGPGIGGHCIPVDPEYLQQTLQQANIPRMTLVDTASELNAAQPVYVSERLLALANRPAPRLLLLGAGYKANSADTRQSPVFAIKHYLHSRGAEVAVYDPLVPNDAGLPLVDCLEDVYDAAMVVTNHRVFRDVTEILTCPILDTRNLLSGSLVTAL